jgi:hypothetical protein
MRSTTWWTVALLAVACGRGSSAGPWPVQAFVEGPTATNAEVVRLFVVVVPTPFDRVELALDGVVIGELVPPYEYDWRTEGLEDGTYRFSARVKKGSSTATSPPLDVKLDRAGPRLAGASPDPGTLLSPPWPDVLLTFDERIDPLSFGEDDVIVTRPDESAVSATVTLDPADATTLRVRPNSWGDGSITVRVSGLEDLAGNAMEAVSVAYPTTSTRILAGGRGDVSNPGLAVDATGRVVVAFLEDVELVVLRAPLDLQSPVERLEPAAAIRGFDVSVAIGPDGEPVVAVAQFGAIQLWRWDGAGWVALGPAAPDDRYSVGPSLAFDGAGHAVLAWESMTKAPEPPYYMVSYVVRAARLVDGEWEDLGDLHDEAIYGTAPSVAVASDGTPFVAWLDASSLEAPARLSYWNGEAWMDAWPPLAQWGWPILRMVGNVPHVAITDYDSASVLAWEAGAWVPSLGDPCAVQFRAGERSEAFDVDEAGTPAFVRVAPGGALTVNFRNRSDQLAGFTQRAVDPERAVRSPAIALRNVDTPWSPDHRYLHLAWIEEGGDEDALLLSTMVR